MQPIDDSNKKSVKKLEQAPRKKDSIECPEAASDYEKLQVNDGKGCKPGKNPRWRRDNPAAYIINYRILDENSLSYVKEQFAQVSRLHTPCVGCFSKSYAKLAINYLSHSSQIDGFSLVTETPTPPRRPKIANSVNFLHKYSLLFSQRVSEGVTSVMDSLKRSPQVSREGCMDALGLSSQIDKNAFNKGLVGRTPLHDSIPEHMVDPCPAHLKPNKPILDAESTNEHRIRESFEKDGVEIPGLDKENQVHNDQGMLISERKNTRISLHCSQVVYLCWIDR